MPINVDKISTLCNFYKQATIETDMAKRIMLSVIPSLMSKTEMHHSGGFDYKALKSAAAGAKDLIKYGAKACVGEMEFFGEGLGENYSSILHGYVKDIKEEDIPKVMEIRKKFNSIEKTKEEAKRLVRDGKYKECLQLCVKSFNDTDYWQSSYGGIAWGKIADTLLKMEEKRELLRLIKEESVNQPDPKTDYLQMEVETLKEIIVLMNVFDGLAHNTGSIMPKVVSEEVKDLNKGSSSYGGGDDDDYYNTQIDETKYQNKIKRLMDVKEIDNPFTVYKEVQKVIEQPENKHMFGDWSTKIVNHPEFASAKSLKEMQNELRIIKLRKELKEYLSKFDTLFDKLNTVKDSIINIHEPEKNKGNFSQVYQLGAELSTIYSNLYYKIDGTISQIRAANPELAKKLIELRQSLANTNLSHLINTLYETAGDYSYSSNKYKKDPGQFLTDLNQIKKMYRHVPGLIDQYVG